MSAETNTGTDTSWSAEELNRVGAAEELQIASRRGDGTLRLDPRR